MHFNLINSGNDLSQVVHMLNISHGTVAKDFGFTKDNNPTNNAFIDDPALRTQLNKGIELYTLSINSKMIGCIAIEKSAKEMDTFYIEKVKPEKFLIILK
jgi:hypothetical protein